MQKAKAKLPSLFQNYVVCFSKIFNSNLLIFAVEILKFSVRC